ncbi:MAG: YtxH domain-containing protein [Gemmatimonadetes bacterium]|nr:YtxH domain-containing protein [Gemmatimonadota bacterium]
MRKSRGREIEERHANEAARSAVSFLSGVLLGAVLGATAALLLAPQSGRRTRRMLRRAARDLRDSATHRLDDLTGEVRGKVEDVVAGARRRVVG